MNRKIESTDGKLAVKVLDQDRTTESGLLVRDTYADRFIRCEAVGVGEVYTNSKGYKRKPPCRNGDNIYIRKPSRKPDFRLDGDDYYSIPFIEVIAVES